MNIGTQCKVRGEKQRGQQPPKQNMIFRWILWFINNVDFIIKYKKYNENYTDYTTRIIYVNNMYKTESDVVKFLSVTFNIMD